MTDKPQVSPRDLDDLARTLWGEARGEGFEGMHAVGCVARNRAAHPRWWGGPSVSSVCLKPWQFSCRNPNDPNRNKLLSVTEEDPAFRVALEVARGILDGSLPDITNGADSYFVTKMKNPPKWAEGRNPCAIIGAHSFYRLEI